MYVPAPPPRVPLTHAFQNLAAETAAYLTTKHPDYAVLAARIAISNLHKETKKSFSKVVDALYNYGSRHSSPAPPPMTHPSHSQPQERQSCWYDL